MYKVTRLRALRILRGLTLDQLAGEIGSVKTRLSQAETHPATVGPNLQRRLERHFDVPFKRLVKQIDLSALADAMAERWRAEA